MPFTRATTFDAIPVSYTLLTTALAGWISGGQFIHYLLSAVTVLCMRWTAFFLHRRVTTYAFAFDPEEPHATPFLHALHHLFQTALRTKLPFRIRIHHFRPSSRFIPTFELIQNDLALTQCVERKARLNQPGIWIAEHPLPLPIPANQALTLSFHPTHDNRIRVRQDETTFAYTPSIILPLIVLTAIACFLDCDTFLAVAISALLISVLK